MPDITVNPEAVCKTYGYSAQLECMECNSNFVNGCSCLHDFDITEINVWCEACQDVHRVDIDELLDSGDIRISSNSEDYRDSDNDWWDDDSTWATDDDKRYNDYWASKTDPSYTGSSLFKTMIHSTCRHYNCPVELGEVTVYASSQHTRKYDDPAPDFGLYLDTIWKPACLAYQVEWQDYGLPEYLDVAARAIIDVYNKASQGLWVEVGCIGGHGRTGTALACMAVLAGMPPKEAIGHVRGTYCGKAIESKSQEWFVEWFSIYINGGKIQDYYDDIEYTFDGPFHWDSYLPTLFAQGAPPEDIVVKRKETSWTAKVAVDKEDAVTTHPDDVFDGPDTYDIEDAVVVDDIVDDMVQEKLIYG